MFALVCGWWVEFGLLMFWLSFSFSGMGFVIFDYGAVFGGDVGFLCCVLCVQCCCALSFDA